MELLSLAYEVNVFASHLFNRFILSLLTVSVIFVNISVFPVVKNEYYLTCLL